MALPSAEIVSSQTFEVGQQVAYMPRGAAVPVVGRVFRTVRSGDSDFVEIAQGDRLALVLASRVLDTTPEMRREASRSARGTLFVPEGGREPV